ncbi:DUF4123 domain-containing protein [Sorangium sp. So ce134]
MGSPERLLDLLFPDLPDGDAPGVYALVDGASDRRIHGLVTRSRLERCCLFEGNLPRELAEAAPYLARLDRAAPLARDLVRLGWGEGWGVFVVSRAGLEALRRHLRRFLRVVDHRGRRLVFRFHDPRVLRVYLPTCTRGEAAAFFGPALGFVMEGEARRFALEVRLEEGALRCDRLDLEADPGAAAERSTVALAPDEPPRAPGKVPQIRAAQMAAFQRHAEQGFVERAASFLRERTPEAIAGLDGETLRRRIEAGLLRARRRGIQRGDSQMMFVSLMFLVAPGFDRHAAVERVLRDPDIPPDEAILRLGLNLSEEDWREARALRDERAWDAALDA